jgi:hypothetical protein
MRYRNSDRFKSTRGNIAGPVDYAALAGVPDQAVEKATTVAELKRIWRERGYAGDLDERARAMLAARAAKKLTRA